MMRWSVPFLLIGAIHEWSSLFGGSILLVE